MENERYVIGKDFNQKIGLFMIMKQTQIFADATRKKKQENLWKINANKSDILWENWRNKKWH